MWFHPGSGSGVEAEVAVRLVSPDETVLIEKQGSIFLPPYLFEPSLPATGVYYIQVRPVSGSVGRYSLGLTVSEASVPTTPGATPPSATTAPAGSSLPAASRQFQWPTSRRAISGWTYHDPDNPSHIGLDIAAQRWDPIVAVAAGEVVFAEWAGGYGNLVIVDHRDDWRSYYAHLTEIAVNVGQEVRQGETLGGAGTTGFSTGTHLHFELRYRGRPVDPHIYLP
jgi:murein DD-endopeptidase MepM/ murein hydrolase activator NlpD